MLRFSVLMLTHNRGEILKQALLALKTTLARPDVEFIVLDNGSTDFVTLGLLDWIALKHRVIRKDVNHGVAAGRNLLLSVATGQYIVFLDADAVIIRDNWLDVLGHVLDNDPSVGLVGAGGAVMASDWSRFFSSGPGPCDSVAGYCQMFRASLVTERNCRLDERFSPFWVEDADFCFQIRSLGFGVVCVPVGVLHLTEHGQLILDDPVLNEHMALLREKWRGQAVIRLEGAYV